MRGEGGSIFDFLPQRPLNGGSLWREVEDDVEGLREDGLGLNREDKDDRNVWQMLKVGMDNR